MPSAYNEVGAGCGEHLGGLRDSSSSDHDHHRPPLLPSAADAAAINAHKKYMLFCSDRKQLDGKLVSGSFTYTAEANILRTFASSGQYVIPRNTAALVNSLSSGQCRHDEPTLTSGAAYSRLLEKISEMTVYQQFEPDWFEESHVRVPTPSLASPSPLLPSSSTGQPSGVLLGLDAVAQQQAAGAACATADDDVGRATTGDSGVISDMLSEDDSFRLKGGDPNHERARLQLV